MGEGVGHRFAPLQVFLGHVLRGVGRQSHHRLSWWECCGYQGRKKRKTTNAIYVTDSQGIPLAMSTPASGSHNDVYNISEVLSELFSGLNSSALTVSGLFLNADAGFDTEQFRRGRHKARFFQTSLSTNAEESKGRKNS